MGGGLEENAHPGVEGRMEGVSIAAVGDVMDEASRIEMW